MSKGTTLDLGVLTQRLVTHDTATKFKDLQEKRKSALVEHLKTNVIPKISNCRIEVTDVTRLSKAYDIKLSYNGKLYDHDLRDQVRNDSRFASYVKFYSQGNTEEHIILEDMYGRNFFMPRSNDHIIVCLIVLISVLYYIQMINKPSRYDPFYRIN
jgi:hypothetical protein